MSITENRLNEIQGRLDAATKDWSNQAPASNQVWSFFAHAPTDLADLLAEVHRLKTRVGSLQSENHLLSTALTTSQHREAAARLLPAKMDW